MKRPLTIAVLLLAASGVAYVLLGAPAPQPAHESPSDLPKPASGLTVYYFDMGKDCTTCLNLESYTRETLETHYAKELASGAIQWAVVNVDLPENGHFVAEFGLYTKSVVLAERVDNEIVWHDNLSRIWELVYDKEAYMEYIRAQVEQALGAEH